MMDPETRKAVHTRLRRIGGQVAGIEKMVEIAEEFRKVSGMPVAIQSNAGLPELRDGELFYSETPEFMAGHVKRLLELGVSVIV